MHDLRGCEPTHLADSTEVGNYREYCDEPSRSISFSFGSTAPIQALAASMKLSVSLQLLDLGQSVGLLGRVIARPLLVYKHRKTHTQHKH
jgi:hypothetical protein